MKQKIEIILLICILAITILTALRQSEVQAVVTPQSVSVSSNEYQIIQVAPNTIGIVDTGVHSGIPGQLIVIEYNSESKSFQVVTTIDVNEIIYHPEEYGIPIKQ